MLKPSMDHCTDVQILQVQYMLLIDVLIKAIKLLTLKPGVQLQSS